jgi:hypothetical protein
MKIKKGRLQQIIREELTRVLSEEADSDADGSLDADELRDLANRLEGGPHSVSFIDQETGEVLSLGTRGKGPYKDIPASKADEYIRVLNLNALSDNPGLDGDREIGIGKEDFEKLEAHIDEPIQAAKDAAYRAEQERLDPKRLKDKLRRRAKIAGKEYLADNPAANLDGDAMDLAASVLYRFEPDEREELLRAFDDDEYLLNLYAAESM